MSIRQKGVWTKPGKYRTLYEVLDYIDPIRVVHIYALEMSLV